MGVISNQTNMGSKIYMLSKGDLVKIGKGAGIAAIGAVLTYLTSVVTNTDFSFTYAGVLYNYTAIVVAGWSIVANVARKFFSDTTV